MVFVIAMLAGFTVSYLWSASDVVPDTDPDLAPWIDAVEGDAE